MFYGLNKLIKNILPKTLFYRALLIVAVPVIVLQLVITIVFFDSLWIKTNIGMTRALVGEIKTFINSYNLEGADKTFVENTFEEYLEIDVVFYQNKEFSDVMNEKWYSPIDRSLRRELKSSMGNNQFWFSTTDYLELVNIRIKYKNGYFEFLVPRDRLTSSSARLFGLWISVPAVFLICVAMIFLKNQTRPITNLAKAAEKFGRGEEVDDYRPSGSLEIRQAGYEFDKMRKRILRHLNQRSEMLSGISHDLRTPLTRMKLQLSFIKDKEISLKMSEDINEMEKMLNEYLQFTSSTHSEKNEIFDLTKLLYETIDRYENNNISKKLSQNILINGRKNLLKRSFNNIIDNGLKYAKKINIELNQNGKNIFLIIEDNGPGIPPSEYENVFKPFYKIDKGRGETKSSVGLGLSIASDIIRSHGGHIQLRKSSMNGLGVKIFLPA